MQVEQAQVLEALKVVRDPDLNRDIVSLGFVKELNVDQGRVAFTIELTTPACPVKDQMRDQARALVMNVAGVTDVQIDMTAAVRTSAVGDAARQPVQGVKNVIAVGAGKGGVGKTTVAVNLAVALAQIGSRVAMIDGDIYGPNVPTMLGLDTQLVADEEGRIIPQGMREGSPSFNAALIGYLEATRGDDIAAANALAPPNAYPNHALDWIRQRATSMTAQAAWDAASAP